MKSVLFTILVTCSVALAAVFRSPIPIHKDHPECFYEPTNTYYSPGESFTAPNCIQMTCTEEFNLFGISCIKLVTPDPGDPCIIVPEDLNKTYPDCCARFKCN